MSRIIHDCAQGSAEWHTARCGLLTASVAHVPFLAGKSKDKESTQRRDLRTQLALERIVGVSCEKAFTAEDTERGKALEAEALAAYEARTGVLLSRVGFVSRDDLPIGCSPDGAVLGRTITVPTEFDGGVDVKAPRPANHLAYLRDPASLVAAYEAQIRHTLWITGAPWWDLASYCPQFPPASRLVMVRLVPHVQEKQFDIYKAMGFDGRLALRGVDLAAHELVVRQFLREVDAEEAEIRRMSDGKEAA